MVTTPKTEQIFIGMNDQVIELTGTDKEAFLKQRAKDLAEEQLRETEYKAKQETKNLTIKKLAEVAGLTEEELKVVLNG